MNRERTPGWVDGDVPDRRQPLDPPIGFRSGESSSRPRSHVGCARGRRTVRAHEAGRAVELVGRAAYWVVVAAMLACSGVAFAQGEPPTDDPELQPTEAADADADEVSEFDALVMKGADAYAKRDYRKALEHFQAAHAIDPVPDLLFNMGIIADSLGEFELALDYLNEFVVQPDIDVSARKEALSRIDQLQQLQALQNQDEPTTDEPAVDTTKDERVAEPDAMPPAPPPEPNYTGPGVVLGIGLVTMAAGGVTAGLALSEHSAFEDASTLEERRDAADTGETLALLSDILLPTGGAITAAGIIWLAVVATTDTGGDGTVMVTPSVAEDGGRVDLRVKF